MNAVRRSVGHLPVRIPALASKSHKTTTTISVLSPLRALTTPPSQRSQSTVAAAVAAFFNMTKKNNPPAGGADGDTADGDKLPALTPQEFRVYNALSERMDLFHEDFRQSWQLLWKACTTNKRPQGMTLRQFLDRGIMFCQHLTNHHNLEERAVFPVLGRRMPEFRADLPDQHKEIHAGLISMSGYLRKCRDSEADFVMGELRDRMEGWGPTLLQHLDEEVQALRAENMRKYWTVDDIKKMGFAYT